jgi:8-oxo-dGTP diphosphatase
MKMNTEKQYVLGFLFDPEKSTVLLIEKKRPAWQSGRLNGIGGKVEPGELPLTAMVREFEEETGVILTRWTQFAVMRGNDSAVGSPEDYLIHCYKAFSYSIGATKTATDEEVFCIRLDNFLNCPIMPNLAWLIPLALDGDTRADVITAPSTVPLLKPPVALSGSLTALPRADFHSSEPQD